MRSMLFQDIILHGMVIPYGHLETAVIFKVSKSKKNDVLTLDLDDGTSRFS